MHIQSATTEDDRYGCNMTRWLVRLQIAGSLFPIVEDGVPMHWELGIRHVSIYLLPTRYGIKMWYTAETWLHKWFCARGRRTQQIQAGLYSAGGVLEARLFNVFQTYPPESIWGDAKTLTPNCDSIIILSSMYLHPVEISLEDRWQDSVRIPCQLRYGNKFISLTYYCPVSSSIAISPIVRSSSAGLSITILLSVWAKVLYRDIFAATRPKSTTTKGSVGRRLSCM